MATNGKRGAGRQGSVKKRDQVYSPRNKRWTKRGTDRKFVDQMAHRGMKFKGVRIK